MRTWSSSRGPDDRRPAVTPTPRPGCVRWVTGNADPEGKLPWPFGKTTYYAWWGAGLWPLWLASLPATCGSPSSDAQSSARRLLAAWVVPPHGSRLSCPGMFWQHYYLLLRPGRRDGRLPSGWSMPSREFDRTAACRYALVAPRPARPRSGGRLRIQVRDYLGLTPDEITSEFKGGQQWVEPPRVRPRPRRAVEGLG